METKNEKRTARRLRLAIWALCLSAIVAKLTYDLLMSRQRGALPEELVGVTWFVIVWLCVHARAANWTWPPRRAALLITHPVSSLVVLALLFVVYALRH